MSEETTAVATVEGNHLAGFGSKSSFDLLIRQSQLISSSTLVPEQFSIFDKKGVLKSKDEQKYALSNATIAMEMAGRIGASPLMVCQNLYIVHGRPGWSSQFIIAAINASGKFSPLRYTITDPEPEREVSCQVTEWENGKKVTKTIKEKIKNRVCIAWAIEKETGERLESPPVSLEMAVQEGWMSKAGSKWQTMPDLMMRYRSASFFGRLYAPDLLMGIRSEEEIQDIIDITPEAAPKQKRAAAILDKFTDETAEIPMTKEEIAEVTEPEEIIVPAVLEHAHTDLLQEVFALITKLSVIQGESPDDVLSTLTKEKVSCLIDLEDKSAAYLTDIKLLTENAIASEA